MALIRLAASSSWPCLQVDLRQPSRLTCCSWSLLSVPLTWIGSRLMNLTKWISAASQTLSVVDFRHFVSRRAELYALLLAIDVIRRSKEKNFVFFSDSMSSLQSINGFNLDSDLVQKFLKDCTVLAKKWQKHYSPLDSKSCGNPRQ